MRPWQGSVHNINADAHSKNGTFVNGRRVGRLEFITLHHNTEIQFAVPSSSHDDKRTIGARR